mmetsp:Transcript_7891/g.21735  ORF Transcript_7891/g.21735 Transcript_7891/m.21735 type:complete len:162 (-) Transcript_7891:1012-1497(-)
MSFMHCASDPALTVGWGILKHYHASTKNLRLKLFRPIPVSDVSLACASHARPHMSLRLVQGDGQKEKCWQDVRLATTLTETLDHCEIESQNARMQMTTPAIEENKPQGSEEIQSRPKATTISSDPGGPFHVTLSQRDGPQDAEHQQTEDQTRQLKTGWSND